VKPEEALAAARERAAARSWPEVPGFSVEPVESVTLDQLYEWAVIEPELEGLYSTRRVVGGPITFVKRLVARSLRQYLGQMIAQQTRFNLQLTVYVARLADRVDELERRAGDGDR
jgi:hypothetical protein